MQTMKSVARAVCVPSKEVCSLLGLPDSNLSGEHRIAIGRWWLQCGWPAAQDGASREAVKIGSAFPTIRHSSLYHRIFKVVWGWLMIWLSKKRWIAIAFDLAETASRKSSPQPWREGSEGDHARSMYDNTRNRNLFLLSFLLPERTITMRLSSLSVHRCSSPKC